MNWLIAALCTSTLCCATCLWAWYRGGLKRWLYLIIGLTSGYFAVIYALIMAGEVGSRDAGETYFRPAIALVFFLLSLIAFLDAATRRR